jgi:hypothetical protein
MRYSSSRTREALFPVVNHDCACNVMLASFVARQQPTTCTITPLNFGVGLTATFTVGLRLALFRPLISAHFVFALAFAVRAFAAARDAFVAIARRCSAVIFFSRALPPLRPKSDRYFEIAEFLFMVGANVYLFCLDGQQTDRCENIRIGFAHITQSAQKFQSLHKNPRSGLA